MVSPHGILDALYIDVDFVRHSRAGSWRREPLGHLVFIRLAGFFRFHETDFVQP
jgi:hypothetical protein